jgi:hypothetical protein
MMKRELLGGRKLLLLFFTVCFFVSCKLCTVIHEYQLSTGHLKVNKTTGEVLADFFTDCDSIAKENKIANLKYYVKFKSIDGNFFCFLSATNLPVPFYEDTTSLNINWAVVRAY